MDTPARKAYSSLTAGLWSGEMAAVSEAGEAQLRAGFLPLQMARVMLPGC